LTGEPFIASHSNLRALCNHPRNLTDDQAKAIIERDGRIGITFFPYFLREGGGAGIADVLRHLERCCELGGVHCVGFGSDFDGIDQWVKQLEHPGQLYLLKNELSKRYTPEQIDGFLGGNFHSYFLRALPDS
jgi:membrane dipeptidase